MVSERIINVWKGHVGLVPHLNLKERSKVDRTNLGSITTVLQNRWLSYTERERKQGVPYSEINGRRSRAQDSSASKSRACKVRPPRPASYPATTLLLLLLLPPSLLERLLGI